MYESSCVHDLYGDCVAAFHLLYDADEIPSWIVDVVIMPEDTRTSTLVTERMCAQ